MTFNRFHVELPPCSTLHLYVLYMFAIFGFIVIFKRFSDVEFCFCAKTYLYSCWWRKKDENMSPFTFDTLSFDALSLSSCRTIFQKFLFKLDTWYMFAHHVNLRMVYCNFQTVNSLNSSATHLYRKYIPIGDTKPFVHCSITVFSYMHSFLASFFYKNHFSRYTVAYTSWHKWSAIVTNADNATAPDTHAYAHTLRPIPMLYSFQLMFSKVFVTCIN